MKKKIALAVLLLTTVSVIGYPYLLHHWAIYQLKGMGITLPHMGSGNPEYDQLLVAGIFVDAACSTDPRVLPWLLRTRFDVNSKGQQDKTALHCAAAAGRLDQLERLIAHGASMTARTKSVPGADTVAYTPIHLAAAFHHLDAVALLKRLGANIDEPSASGTPLMIALGVRRQQRFVPPLLALRAPPDLLATWRRFQQLGARLDARDDEGNTLLHIAMRTHQRPLIEAMLADGGFDLNARNTPGDTPFTRFVATVERVQTGTGGPGTTTDLDLIARMIAMGANVRAVNRLGLAPIHGAATSLDLFALLMQHGADAFVAQGSGNTIWTEIQYLPSPDVIAVADTLPALRTPFTPDGKPGSGPLHVFAPLARLDLVQYFLQRGVSPDARDNASRTPLHAVLDGTSPSFAPVNNHIDSVRTLLAAGANPDLHDGADETPLMRAGRLSNGMHSYEIVKMLIARGADVHAVAKLPDGRQRRVLDYFDQAQHPGSVALLLEAGAGKQR